MHLMPGLRLGAQKAGILSIPGFQAKHEWGLTVLSEGDNNEHIMIIQMHESKIQQSQDPMCSAYIPVCIS